MNRFFDLNNHDEMQRHLKQGANGIGVHPGHQGHHVGTHPHHPHPHQGPILQNCF